MKTLFVVPFLALTLATPVLAKDVVTLQKLKAQFAQEQNICKFGDCTLPLGCEIDVITPIGCGGDLSINNLQLLCGDFRKTKNKAERKQKGVCPNLDDYLGACEPGVLE